ncbi:hypothetical protein QJV45_16885 [Listeria booriae]|uniref:Uncharacterized protein n=1 Tax=Listeria booriae TaxID=1552123 RepID=A0A7X0WGP7_9LIST|nr:hypothetical protein [Listeria booriae]MBC1333531.1 hypothetical protein [Listeria booriae]MDT0112144.1 hypothetical protein [Listeria booriae]
MYVCVSYPKKEIINFIDQQGNIHWVSSGDDVWSFCPRDKETCKQWKTYAEIQTAMRIEMEPILYIDAVPDDFYPYFPPTLEGDLAIEKEEMEKFQLHREGKLLMDVQLMKTMNKEIDNNGDNRNSDSN